MAGAGTQTRGTAKLRREYPELVTLEPAEDDGDVFGGAWPLIQEWRELKETHSNQGKGLSWLRTEERFLAVELALLEEHGMTLPPARFPLRGFDRNGQTGWRWKALDDTRQALGRRMLLAWAGRVLTLGRWRSSWAGCRFLLTVWRKSPGGCCKTSFNAPEAVIMTVLFGFTKVSDRRNLGGTIPVARV